MRTSCLAIPLVALSACSSGLLGGGRSDTAIPSGPSAVAVVRNAAGRELGSLTVVETGGGLTTVGTLRGLPPGTHGIHLHAVGSCVAPGFTSAGGHWNPTQKLHGFDNPLGAHLGDMRNITVGADSVATVNTTTPGGTLRGTNGAIDADGLAVVVHAASDDYRTDPSGNSGARVACGVVAG